MAKTDSYIITAVVILIIIMLICFLNPNSKQKYSKENLTLRRVAEGDSSFVRLYDDWDGTKLLFELENKSPYNANEKYFKDFYRGQVRLIDINILPSVDESDPARGVKIWAYYPNSNISTSISMEYETNQFDMPEHRLNAYNGFVLLAEAKPGERVVVQVDIPVKKIFMVSRI